MSTTTKLKNWFQQKKDASVSFVAEKILAKKLAPYGELMDFQLHSTENRASLKLLLRGDSEPVSLFIDEYQLSQEANGMVVTILKAGASREWLAQLLRDFLVGRPMPVPEQFASYARVLL